MGFLGLKAQYNVFTPYEDPRSAQSAPIQQTYGYIKSSSGWVRVNIQVRVSEYSVTVVAYKQKNNSGYDQYYNTYGGNNWIKCNASAQEVTSFEDGRVAANNFDYKAYVTGLGTIYF